jgi:hypothetical protein
MNTLTHFRVNAFLIHLAGSCVIAALFAALLYWKLYPYPFHIISGGLSLFALVCSVDVVLGPLLTFVVANRLKKSSELRRDFAAIICIQLLALVYGFYTAYAARPIYAVLEVDRIKIVPASEISPQELAKAPMPLRDVSLFGIRLIGVRDFKDNDEKFNSIELALKGKDISIRPEMWAIWSEKHSTQVQSRAYRWSSLQKSHQAIATQLEAFAKSRGLDWNVLLVMPVHARTTSMSAVFDPSGANLMGYIEGDLLDIPLK